MAKVSVLVIDASRKNWLDEFTQAVAVLQGELDQDSEQEAVADAIRHGEGWDGELDLDHEDYGDEDYGDEEWL